MEFITLKLSPCPWCQEAPRLMHTDMAQSNNKAVRIACQNYSCLAKPEFVFDSSFLSHDEIEVYAVKAWNLRKKEVPDGSIN